MPLVGRGVSRLPNGAGSQRWSQGSPVRESFRKKDFAARLANIGLSTETRGYSQAQTRRPVPFAASRTRRGSG
jgi:hypothetical protein